MEVALEVGTEVVTEQVMDLATDLATELDTEARMAVSTVALTGVVKIAAARPAARPAVLLAEGQAAATVSTPHRLCLTLVMGWVTTLRTQLTGMWAVGPESLGFFKCQLRPGQTVVCAFSFPCCSSCCSRSCTTCWRLLPPRLRCRRVRDRAPRLLL